MNAEQIGIALRGRRNSSGWLVRCPCPNHGKGRGDRNPSLSVSDGDDGRLLLLCFAGCEFVDILDELKHRGLVEDKEAAHSARIEQVEHAPNADALIIWRASECLPYTIAAEYLERRGITLQPASLRSRIGKRAMVAGVQSPGGKIIAVQTTLLTPEGEKASGTSRITTGSLGNGAVRFAPAAEVMGLADGVETALSAQMLAEVPCWASLGAARLHRVWLPSIVKEVHIFQDNDAPGRTAAKRAADVHTAAGRKVYLRSPPDQCKDYNDYLNLIADRDGRDVLPAQSAEDAA